MQYMAPGVKSQILVVYNLVVTIDILYYVETNAVKSRQ